MTSNKRSAWRAASRDLAAANHNRMSRRHNQIPSAPDASERLAAVVKAAARKRSNIERMNTMSITRKDLVTALASLSDTEREQVSSEVSESAARESRMDATAAALADYIRPNREA